MTLTVSAPVRIAALCSLVFTVLVFGGLRMLGTGGGDQSVNEPKVIEHHPFGPRATSMAQKPAAAKSVPAVRRPTVEQAVIAAARKAGLPAALAQSLAHHRTVVVSLYDPYSQVDATALAEARAGAALAGAGFVPLNVLSQAHVGKLTELLGLLPDPGVLVYVRPGTLASKLGGFIDKETVAQAATNAAATIR